MRNTVKGIYGICPLLQVDKWMKVFHSPAKNELQAMSLRGLEKVHIILQNFVAKFQFKAQGSSVEMIYFKLMIQMNTTNFSKFYSNSDLTYKTVMSIEISPLSISCKTKVLPNNEE